MRRDRTEDAASAVGPNVRDALDRAYEQATNIVDLNEPYNWRLTARFLEALETMSLLSPKATTGFTNVVTGLAIKVAVPNIDARYHQVQIQEINPKISFRTVSENIVYPWLSRHNFMGAKSGWQTRTFERPKPYLLNYDENIGAIKTAFLICYDEMQLLDTNVLEGLTYIIYRQIQIRNENQISIKRPYINDEDDIDRLITYFRQHMNYQYGVKGASRLPVLAIYAVYTRLVEEVGRYKDKRLLPLESHSAADARTGSAGDIEISNQDGSIFEALEIKHNIRINESLISDIERFKLANRSIDRYYVLTTHTDCKPSDVMLQQLAEIRARTGCQIIIDGIIPSIQYYLRLLTQPSAVISPYLELIASDPALAQEHRIAWNTIVSKIDE